MKRGSRISHTSTTGNQSQIKLLERQNNRMFYHKDIDIKFRGDGIPPPLKPPSYFVPIDIRARTRSPLG